MAILLRGRTKCGICSKVIGANDRVKMFSAFIGNELDPLMKFHDAAFHEECFRGDPLAERAEARWQLMSAAKSDQRCHHCGRAIERPDDYFIFDLLTEKTDAKAFPFNRLQFHESCLREWPRVQGALTAVSELRESGAYRGREIDCTIEILQRARDSTSQ